MVRCHQLSADHIPVSALLRWLTPIAPLLVEGSFTRLARIGCADEGGASTDSSDIIVPTLRAHRYTQVPPSRKCRHTGMDAGIQAMDGNLTVVQVLNFSNVVRQSLPSLDSGFRHPCRNDGPPTLVYNDERSAWERLTDAPASIFCTKKQILQFTAKLRWHRCRLNTYAFFQPWMDAGASKTSFPRRTSLPLS